MSDDEPVVHKCACGHPKTEHYSGVDFCDVPGCACVEFNSAARLVSETKGPTEFRCQLCEHVWSEHQKAADESSTECFAREDGDVCDCDAFVADLKTPPKQPSKELPPIITGTLEDGRQMSFSTPLDPTRILAATGGNPIMFMTHAGEVTISAGNEDDDD